MARNSILGVFAKSPIKPLEKHIKIVVKCSKQLVPFFEACKADNWNEAAKIRKKLSKLEQDADALKRQLRLELPGGLFMPVDRADLLELLSQQDKIANKAKDQEGVSSGYRKSTSITINQSDVKSVARGELKRIQKDAKAASKKGNTLTRYHLQDVVDRIDVILDPT